MKTQMKVTVLSSTAEFEQNIVRGAKLCYSSADIEALRDKVTPEEAEKFLNMILGLGHGSVLEHSTITFGIEGVSRALTHQLVRHRIASYSQKSQRYVKEAQFEYVVPKDIENNDFARELYIDLMEQIQLTYDMITQELLVDYINDYINEHKDHPFLEEPIADILNVKDFLARFKEIDKKTYLALEKKAIENARYVLPNATETKIQMTINVRALFNFFKERLCERAQDEIRELAWLMWLACMKISPTIFKHAVPSCVHGKCKEGKMSCGKAKEYKEKYNNAIQEILEWKAEQEASAP